MILLDGPSFPLSLELVEGLRDKILYLRTVIYLFILRIRLKNLLFSVYLIDNLLISS